MREMLNARRNKILWVAACAVVLVTAVMIRTGFHVTKATDASKTAPPAIPAITTTVVEEDVPIYQTGIGNVTPVYSVTVRVRVDGQLMRVLFHEGQVVEEGELLAEIDPRPYQAALTQVEGMMVRDQALLANARIDLERYRTLFAQDSIPKQQLDTQEALVRQYEGTVKLDQGQIDNARLQLIYSRVTAPISGRTGVRLVDPGNIVHATDTTGIVVINQIDPIAVLFTVPEEKFQSINQAIRNNGVNPLAVQAFAREDGSLLATGKVILINNQIDTATGTVQLKAVFPNATHRLWPGQYVNTHVILGTREHAVTVPETVVQRGPNGLYAFVVKSDATVAVQPIRVAQTQDGKAIIDEGLAAGTRIVVQGQYKLKAGVKITEVKTIEAAPKSAQEPARPEAAGQKANSR